jgi:RNA polymerase sigma factor (sigma-70 family)
MISLAGAWVRSQDRDSPFDRLFLAEYARVSAIAYRVLGDPQEAEDVAQDVFCSLYRTHGAEVPYAAAWLHRAAVHAALNVIRGRKRRQKRETAGALEQERITPLSEASLDPQFAAEVAEQRREVQRALAHLPEKSASVLLLRYSGLSYAEVAAAMNISIGQIGTLLRRAEAGLRKEMTRETPR